MAQNEASSGAVQSIERAFLVLETIANNGNMTLNDLHKTLGLNKPSLSRITNTLDSLGYLDKDERTGEFSLTLKNFEIGAKAVHSVNHMSLIRSYLDKLAAETGAIAQFSVEDHNDLLCLESLSEEGTPFSVYSRMGQRSPLYATSAGKAILSTQSNDEIQHKWEQFDVKRMTPTTLMTFDDLMVDITETRKRGYAIDNEESELGLFCVGAPLMGYNREAIGAISLSVHSKDGLEELGNTVRSYTQQLSDMLGYMSN